MNDEEVQPVTEQATTTAENYRDPYGADPEDIPDPMPEALQASPDDDEREWMEGDAPTG